MRDEQKSIPAPPDNGEWLDRVDLRLRVQSNIDRADAMRLMAIAKAARKIDAFDVSKLCENPAHKTLRHPRCGECQLAARIEELQEELK